MELQTLPARRPAETTAAAAAIALLICKALGVDDPDTLTALAVAIGFIPTVVTWIVELTRRRRTTPEPPPKQPAAKPTRKRRAG